MPAVLAALSAGSRSRPGPHHPRAAGARATRHIAAERGVGQM